MVVQSDFSWLSVALFISQELSQGSHVVSNVTLVKRWPHATAQLPRNPWESSSPRAAAQLS